MEAFELFRKMEKEFFKPQLFDVGSNDDIFDLFEIFTQKRIEILKAMREESFSSIRELAESLNRDIKNVWSDLDVLEKHEVVRFETEGRRKLPRINKKCFVLMVRGNGETEQ